MDLEVVAHELERAARRVLDATLPGASRDTTTVSGSEVGHLELAAWLNGVTHACASDREELVADAMSVHNALLHNAADFSATDEANAQQFRIDLRRLGP